MREVEVLQLICQKIDYKSFKNQTYNIMICWAFFSALILLLQTMTFQTNFFMKSIGCTSFAQRVAGSANCFSFHFKIIQHFIGRSGLSRNPIQIKPIRAILFSRQTLINIKIGINNDFFARIATCGTNGIFRPFTTSYAIFVTG